jgi:hypothetical protein
LTHPDKEIHLCSERCDKRLADYSQVDALVVWYKSVYFRIWGGRATETRRDGSWPRNASKGQASR